jgi:hypothetical protein
MTIPATDRLVTVPSLADVVAAPEKADGLPGRAILGLLAELIGVQHRLMLQALANGIEPAPVREENRLLTVEEAAQRLGVTPRTMKALLRRPAYNPAAVVLSRKNIRVSAARLHDIMLGGGPRARRRAG